MSNKEALEALVAEARQHGYFLAEVDQSDHDHAEELSRNQVEISDLETQLLEATLKADDARFIIELLETDCDSAEDELAALEEETRRGHAVLCSLQKRHDELKEVTDFLNDEVVQAKDTQGIICSALGIDESSSLEDIVTAIMLLKSAAKSARSKKKAKKPSNKKVAGKKGKATKKRGTKKKS